MKVKKIPIADYLSKKSVYTIHRVSNMEKAKKFYKNALELVVTFEAPLEIGWCEFALPVEGAFLTLSLKRDGEIIPLNVLCFSCINLEKTIKLFEKKGIETSEIVDVAYFISFFTINDPDGNTISFIGAPRKKDRK
ncbi:MAG: VOC family protein [Candidatus Hodarchaeales archaeon]|jgi:predicted enzyme related to lactoylglutathione lyase